MGLKFCDLIPGSMRRPDEDPDLLVQPILDAFCAYEVSTLRPAIESAAELNNIDETRAIEFVLKSLGNPMPFIELTAAQSRRLARALVPMYRKKGTADGIELALLTFLQETAVVIDFAQSSTVSWILGESKLGISTILNPDPQSPNLFRFVVEFDEILNVAQFAQAAQIIEFMKPAWCTYVINDGLNPTTASLPLIEGFEDVSWL